MVVGWVISIVLGWLGDDISWKTYRKTVAAVVISDSEFAISCSDEAS